MKSPRTLRALATAALVSVVAALALVVTPAEQSHDVLADPNWSSVPTSPATPLATTQVPDPNWG